MRSCAAVSGAGSANDTWGRASGTSQTSTTVHIAIDSIAVLDVFKLVKECVSPGIHLVGKVAAVWSSGGRASTVVDGKNLFDGSLSGVSCWLVTYKSTAFVP